MDKSFKENLKNYYNQDAARRNRNKRRAHWKIKVRKNFYTVIKRENKKTLLELGAGAGFDSLFFQKKRIPCHGCRYIFQKHTALPRKRA